MKKNIHEITIKIEGEEWAKALDKAFKKKNKEVKIDGFRKGNAPKDIFIKKFGIESLYMDAVDSAVSIAYGQIIDEKKLKLCNFVRFNLFASRKLLYLLYITVPFICQYP